MGAILVHHFGPFLQWTKINTSMAKKLMAVLHLRNLIGFCDPKSKSSLNYLPMSGTSIRTAKGIKKDEKRLISSLLAVKASVSGKHLVSLMGLS
jgi:hypothetical protein